MAGLRKLAITAVVPLGPANLVYLWLTLPVGVRLRLAAAQNSVTGSLRCVLALVDSSTVDKTAPIIIGEIERQYAVLNDETVQGGMHDWVHFYGDIEIGSTDRILVAQFYNAEAGDTLRLVGGYE